MNFYNDEEESLMDYEFDFYYNLEDVEDKDDFYWGEMSYNHEITNRWDVELTEMELFEMEIKNVK